MSSPPCTVSFFSCGIRMLLFFCSTIPVSAVVSPIVCCCSTYVHISHLNFFDGCCLGFFFFYRPWLLSYYCYTAWWRVQWSFMQMRAPHVAPAANLSLYSYFCYFFLGFASVLPRYFYLHNVPRHVGNLTRALIRAFSDRRDLARHAFLIFAGIWHVLPLVHYLFGADFFRF